MQHGTQARNLSIGNLQSEQGSPTTARSRCALDPAELEPLGRDCIICDRCEAPPATGPSGKDVLQTNLVDERDMQLERAMEQPSDTRHTGAVPVADFSCSLPLGCRMDDNNDGQT